MNGAGGVDANPSLFPVYYVLLSSFVLIPPPLSQAPEEDVCSAKNEELRWSNHLPYPWSSAQQSHRYPSCRREGAVSACL